MEVSLASLTWLWSTGSHSVWSRVEVSVYQKVQLFLRPWKDMQGVTLPGLPWHTYLHPESWGCTGGTAYIWGLEVLLKKELCQHKTQYCCIFLKLYKYPHNIHLLFLQVPAQSKFAFIPTEFEGKIILLFRIIIVLSS